MSNLKKLNDNDLNIIVEAFSRIVEEELSNNISSKEVINEDIDIDVSYEDEQLDVNLDVNVDVDALSEVEKENIEKIIDIAFEKLDHYIDENFRE